MTIYVIHEEQKGIGSHFDTTAACVYDNYADALNAAKRMVNNYAATLDCKTQVIPQINGYKLKCFGENRKSLIAVEYTIESHILIKSKEKIKS